MRTDILLKKDSILHWISETRPKSFMCQQLDCRPATLEFYLTKLNLEYPGNRGLKGLKTDKKRKTAINYSESAGLVKSAKLCKKLIEDGIKKHCCEKCLNTTWNNLPIPVELHHVDGNRFNNDLKNLQILCPNCHTQTPNYGSKNTFKKRNGQ